MLVGRLLRKCGRPLKLIVQIAISKAEISGVLDSFDWSSRFQRVDKSRKEAGNDPEATNQMFDRVLGDSSPFEAKSSLFDVSRWIGSGPEKEPPAVVVQKPEPNPPVIVLSKPTYPCGGEAPHPTISENLHKNSA
jgi:hypothetical protein